MQRRGQDVDPRPLDTFAANGGNCLFRKQFTVMGWYQ
jgi:hypothetical protein